MKITPFFAFEQASWADVALPFHFDLFVTRRDTRRDARHGYLYLSRFLERQVFFNACSHAGIVHVGCFCFRLSDVSVTSSTLIMCLIDVFKKDVCHVSLQRAPPGQIRSNAIPSREVPKELSRCRLCHLPLQRVSPRAKNQPGVTPAKMSVSAGRPMFQPRPSRGREIRCLRIIIRSLRMRSRFSRIFFWKSPDSRLKSKPVGSRKGFSRDQHAPPQKSNVFIDWCKIWWKPSRCGSTRWTRTRSID